MRSTADAVYKGQVEDAYAVVCQHIEAAAAEGSFATAVVVKNPLFVDTVQARLARAGFVVRMVGPSLILSWA